MTRIHSLRGFTLITLLWPLSLSVAATDPGPGFARCSVVADQRRRIEGTLDDMGRVLLQEEIFLELQKVIKEFGNPKTEYPQAFLRTCFQNKSSLIRKNYQLASPAARDTFQMHSILGELYEFDGNIKDALDSYRKALKREPNHYQTQQRAYNLWFKQELATLKEMDAKLLDLPRLERFITQGNEFLLPIVSNPSAPKDQKISALRDRAAILTKFDRRAEAAVDFKRILDIDSKNAPALRELAAFELARDRKGFARGYLERLSQIEPTNAAVLTTLLKLQTTTDDAAGCLNAVQSAHRNGLKPTTDTRSYEAFCLAKLGRYAEAEKIQAEVNKADPNNAVAKMTRSAFQEKRADEALKGGQPGVALAELNESLKLNPGDVRVKKKMALIVYDFQRAANFQPATAATKDMDRALELLAPSVELDLIDSPTLQVMASAAVHSSKPASGAPACDRQAKDFGTPSDIDFVLDCMRIWGAAGQPERAKRMAQDALKLPRFKPNEARIYQALQTMR